MYSLLSVFRWLVIIITATCLVMWGVGLLFGGTYDNGALYFGIILLLFAYWEYRVQNKRHNIDK